MGGLRVAIRQERRADEALPQTHRGETIQVQPLRQVNTQPPSNTHTKKKYYKHTMNFELDDFQVIKLVSISV